MNERIDRRTFLKHAGIVAGASAAVGLGGGLFVARRRTPWNGDAFAPPGTPPVAVVRATSYDGDLEGTVLDGLRAVGADVRGRSVLLKPNLIEFDRTTVINTDPRLIAATVLAMRRLGARSVVVGEGPGHRRDTGFVVEATGLLEVLRSVETPFVDLNTAPVVRRPLESWFTELRELWLPRPVVDADVVVSMPKMKTHHWAGVTLSLKNCFGCVPSRIYGWPKNVLHWAGLDQAIVDVAAAVRPALQIVDGIVGMEGNGPIQGTPVPMGLLVFGTDPVATDATAARLMGFDPTRVPSIANAAMFLGQAEPGSIRQRGEDIDALVVDVEVLPSFEGMKLGAEASDATAPIGPG